MKIKQVEGLSVFLEQCAQMPDAMLTGVIPIINGDDSRELISSDRAISDAASPSAYYIWTSAKVNTQILAAQMSVKGLVTETTNFTLELTDAGKYIRYNSASEANCTVPPNSSVAFPVNTMIMIRQAGAGVLAMAAGSGVTLNGALNTPGQHKNITLIKIDTNVWDVIGGV